MSINIEKNKMVSINDKTAADATEGQRKVIHTSFLFIYLLMNLIVYGIIQSKEV